MEAAHTPLGEPLVPARGLEGGMCLEGFEGYIARAKALNIADAAGEEDTGTETEAAARHMELQEPISGAWIAAAAVMILAIMLLATFVELLVALMPHIKNAAMKGMVSQIASEWKLCTALATVTLAVIECFLLAAGVRALRTLFLGGWPPKMQVLACGTLQPGLCWCTCLVAQFICIVAYSSSVMIAPTNPPVRQMLQCCYLQFGAASLLWTLLAFLWVLCRAFDTSTPQRPSTTVFDQLRSFLAVLWHLSFSYLTWWILGSRLAGPEWMRAELRRAEKLELLQVVGAPPWLREEVGPHLGRLEVSDVLRYLAVAVTASLLVWVVVAWLAAISDCEGSSADDEGVDATDVTEENGAQGRPPTADNMKRDDSEAAAENASGMEPQIEPAEDPWLPAGRLILQGGWIGPEEKALMVFLATVVGLLVAFSIAHSDFHNMFEIISYITSDWKLCAGLAALAVLEYFLIVPGFKALRTSLLREGWPPKVSVLAWSTLQPGLRWHTCFWAQIFLIETLVPKGRAADLLKLCHILQFSGLSFLWTLLACLSGLCRVLGSPQSPQQPSTVFAQLGSFLALLWHLPFSFGALWMQAQLWRMELEPLAWHEVLYAMQRLCEKAGLEDGQTFVEAIVLLSWMWLAVAWLLRVKQAASATAVKKPHLP